MLHMMMGMDFHATPAMIAPLVQTVQIKVGTRGASRSRLAKPTWLSDTMYTIMGNRER
jgi:hypothetical protein